MFPNRRGEGKQCAVVHTPKIAQREMPQGEPDLRDRTGGINACDHGKYRSEQATYQQFDPLGVYPRTFREVQPRQGSWKAFYEAITEGRQRLRFKLLSPGM